MRGKVFAQRTQHSVVAERWESRQNPKCVFTRAKICRKARDATHDDGLACAGML
jgi:hypothetical protein